MRYDQIGLRAPLRVLCDVADWPAEGVGWRLVADGGEAADVVVTGCDGTLAALGLPLIVVPVDETPLALVEAADDLVFLDDAPDVIAAILQRVGAGEAAGLRERNDGAALISALSQEAARIADALARLADDRARGGDSAAPVPVDARLVRGIIRLRRDRERHFPAELFADPAWDMLLDLASARLEGQRVSVSSLCIAAAVPTTTALRWIRSLSEAGIFVRKTDDEDARRTWIALSDAASEAVMAWLRRFAAAFAPV